MFGLLLWWTWERAGVWGRLRSFEAGGREKFTSEISQWEF